MASWVKGGRGPGWGLTALLLGVLVLGAAACTPHRKLYPRLHALAGQAKFAEAATLVEASRSDYGDRNEVLYNLDRGVFHHYAGNYAASNRAFELAEQRIDDLYTESLAGHVGAFLINDNTLPYRGEDFEGVMINIYRALNYIQLGNVDEALVEARKVNEKLLFINRQYEPDKQNVYSEDAFARMLMGVFYEIGGTRDDINDAFISNRLAVKAYEQNFAQLYGVTLPTVLKSNLVTTADFMGENDFALAKQRFPQVEALRLSEKGKLGQLFFIHFAGRGPVKVESSITAFMPNGRLFKIAFPQYRSNFYLIHSSRILVEGVAKADLEVAEPVGPIAIKNLENRKGRIAAKAIARATTKYVAALALEQQARKRGGDLAGLVARAAGSVFTFVTEKADLRAWQTLPDKILVGRVSLKPGTYQVAVQFLSSGGGVFQTRQLGTIEVKAGTTKFFILHSNS